jgi:glycosyltransferase involved in cell wall biosynthesis
MISVVVCTRNRALKLQLCLRHMSEIDLDLDLAWQLVIVDNDSEDGTRAVITQFSRSLPLQYAFEAKRGLSHARNRGIVEAQYPIIAFTDDDCLVSRDWAGGIVTEFAKNPGLSILGGRVELADAGDYPVARRIHDEAEQITTIEQIMTIMIGCNMAFRRSVFDAIGLFDPAFGKGTRIGSAEDIDFLYRALKGGSRIAYSPDVVVRHAHGRGTPASLESLTHDYVKGRGAFYCKFIGDRQIARMAYWEVRSLLRERLRLPAGSRSPKLLRSLAAGALYKLLDGMANGAAGAANRFTD